MHPMATSRVFNNTGFIIRCFGGFIGAAAFKPGVDMEAHMRKVVFLSLLLLSASGAFAAPVKAQNGIHANGAAINIDALPSAPSVAPDAAGNPNCMLASCLAAPTSREVLLTGQGNKELILEWTDSDKLERREGDISYRPRGMLLMRWTMTF